MLESQAECAHRAAKKFHDLSQDFDNVADYVKVIVDIEHEGDDITHQLANKVDATFVTPLDKEDLRALSGALDDITDYIEACTQRLLIYKIVKTRPDLERLLIMLEQITQTTWEAISMLKNKPTRDSMQPLLIKIHEMENTSDRYFRTALSDLFDTVDPDPLMIMKWKEIYDRVELSIDACEDAAHILESVVVKYA